MKRAKFSYIVMSFFTVTSCVETFNPKVSDADSQGTLVVEGRITDREGPYTVTISTSKPIGLDTVFTVTQAAVIIDEENGTSVTLAEVRPGVYQTSQADFMGQVGSRYRLAITLEDGTQYQSSWELLRETPEIADLRFEPEVLETESGTLSGAQLYLDVEGNENASFFKWEIHETWKYKVPFASDSVYLALGIGGSKPEEDIHETCWKRNRVGDIMISSVDDLTSPSIANLPLQFISSDSARFNIRYTAQIEQYALGAKEYDFWRNMENVNENVGELFDKQPFAVTSNLKNLTNEKEPVLGYFSAYAVQSKRVYINRSDFPLGHLPKPAFNSSPTPFIANADPYDCRLYYQPPQCLMEQTWEECQISWDINIALLQDGNLRLWYKEDYWFTTPVCGDCEFYGGTTTQPDFWEE